MTDLSHHLWLKPTGAEYMLLAETIRELAHRMAAPVFDPHVTLLAYLNGSEYECVQRGTQTAQRIQTFDVALTEPGIGESYFQRLFMRVGQTRAIMEANGIASDAFERPRGPYMPHLSLLYGDYLQPVLDEIARALPSHLRMAFRAEALHLIRATSLDPKDWFEVASWPLLTTVCRER